MARRGRTTLERHEIGGTGGRELPPSPTIIENNTAPNQSGGNKGGGGGNVILITGILFIGYLYISRRLPNVFKAIQSPPGIPGLPGGGPPGVIAPATIPAPGGSNPQFGTVPIAPGNNPIPSATGQNRIFRIYFPSSFNAPPVDISAADQTTCRQLVYSATLQATGSPTLAALYQALYCL